VTPHTAPWSVARSQSPIRSSARVKRDRARGENLDRLCLPVMSRRSRLRRLIGMHAPDIVVRNEVRMLRAALEAMLELETTMNVGALGDAGPPPERRRQGVPTERGRSDRGGTPSGPLSEAGK
jgi:DNA-directed RNA polymerase beta' subunit